MSYKNEQKRIIRIPEGQVAPEYAKNILSIEKEANRLNKLQIKEERSLNGKTRDHRSKFTTDSENHKVIPTTFDNKDIYKLKFDKGLIEKIKEEYKITDISQFINEMLVGFLEGNIKPIIIYSNVKSQERTESKVDLINLKLDKLLGIKPKRKAGSKPVEDNKIKEIVEKYSDKS